MTALQVDFNRIDGEISFHCPICGVNITLSMRDYKIEVDDANSTLTVSEPDIINMVNQVPHTVNCEFYLKNAPVEIKTSVIN